MRDGLEASLACSPHCHEQGVVKLRLMERGEELPLIGRAEEFAFLTEAITERGGAVVGGAAGVGKTRLAREVSAALPGWHVAWATATPAASDLPLGSVAGLDLADGETPSRAGRACHG